MSDGTTEEGPSARPGASLRPDRRGYRAADLPAKPQAFLRDTKAPSLRVRVTAAGVKAYVFEAKLNRRNIRRTIGDVRDWAIEAARAGARRLAVLIDEGTDPRELERQQAEAAERLKAEAHAQAEAATVAQTAQALTVGTAWATYIAERRPHRASGTMPTI